MLAIPSFRAALPTIPTRARGPSHTTAQLNCAAAAPQRHRPIVQSRPHLPAVICVVAIHICAFLLLSLQPVRDAVRRESTITVTLIKEPVPARATQFLVPDHQRRMTPDLTPISLTPLPGDAFAPSTAPAPASQTPAATELFLPARAIDAAPAIEPPQFDAAYLNNPPPRYPAQSKRLREQGTVLLRVLVSAAGSAEQVELQTSSGSGRLDDAAMEAVRQWRFVPARRGSTALAGWALVPLEFRLS